MNLAAWGRLLRVSLWPTAAADALAGWVLARDSSSTWIELALFVAASTLIYHGSLALNDVVDREADARTRPGRPLPAGEVRAALAARAAGGMLLVGVLAGALSDGSLRAGAWYAGLALIATLYNTLPRHAWLAPLMLGACRGLNLAGPWWCMRGDEIELFGNTEELVRNTAIAYGLFVFTVARVGRLEDVGSDTELGREPSLWLGLAAVLLAGFPLLGSGGDELGLLVAFALTVSAAVVPAKLAWTTQSWTRKAAEAATGACLRRLLCLTAAASLFAAPDWQAWLAAIAILTGYPLAHSLRQRFPPS